MNYEAKTWEYLNDAKKDSIACFHAAISIRLSIGLILRLFMDYNYTLQWCPDGKSKRNPPAINPPKKNPPVKTPPLVPPKIKRKKKIITEKEDIITIITDLTGNFDYDIDFSTLYLFFSC